MYYNNETTMESTTSSDVKTRMLSNITDKWAQAKSKMTSSPTYQRLSQSSTVQTIQGWAANARVGRIWDLAKEHPKKSVLTVIIIVIVALYFVYWFQRVDRYLKRMNAYPIEPSVQTCSSGLEGTHRLCDFYIAASFKSYLPCTNYYDYASIESIKKVLAKGARYIDLDVMCNDLRPNAEPVVAAGKEVGQWKYTNSLPLNEVIQSISVYGFGSHVPCPSDPLIIHLNFKTWGNDTAVQRSAEIIKEHLRAKLLPAEFGYQGRFSSTNLCTTPIKQLLDRVIISSSGEVSGTDMDELSNVHPESMGNIRDMTYEQVRDSYDAKEITEYARKNLVRVIPSFTGRDKQNFNYMTPWYLGCQLIAMNYTEPDEWMLSYIRRFTKSSYVLKPVKLRYKPVLIQQPLQQSKKVSFEPKQVTTPFYTITY